MKFDDWCGNHRIISDEARQTELLAAVSPYRSREERLVHADKLFATRAKDAIELYQSLYSGGPDDADIAYRIGYGYYRRFRIDGKPEDGAYALKWLSEAHNFDHPEAPVTIGTMYANGFSVGEDLAKANELLAVAASRGSRAAATKLAAGGFEARKRYEGAGADPTKS